MLNLVVCGVGGALLIPLGLMAWGYRRIYRGVGVCFVAIPHLSWEMGPRSDFGIMYGVER
jgi:hypothetical protein